MPVLIRAAANVYNYVKPLLGPPTVMQTSLGILALIFYAGQKKHRLHTLLLSVQFYMEFVQDLFLNWGFFICVYVLYVPRRCF